MGLNNKKQLNLEKIVAFFSDFNTTNFKNVIIRVEGRLR